MARETRVHLFDDLAIADSGERVEAAETRTLGYNGTVVELDLTAEHAKELDELVARYLAAGNVIARAPVSTTAAKLSRAEAAAMRAFATERGLSYRTKHGGSGGIYYSAELRRLWNEHKHAARLTFGEGGEGDGARQ